MRRDPVRTTTLWRLAHGFARMRAFAVILWLALCPHAIAQGASGAASLEDDLRAYAVHINRTPAQPWPGYGMYLGNGLVVTAAHVPETSQSPSRTWSLAEWIGRRISSSRGPWTASI